MIFYLFLATVSVGLAACVGKPVCAPARGVYKNNKCYYLGADRRSYCSRLGLLAIFTLLFAVAACRLNVGNDYARYVEFMHLVNSNAYVPTEAGFNWVTRAVYALSGFENYLLVFALFAGVTLFFFLLAMYEQCDSFPWTFFLFMAFGYYFQSFSTVRYYLALALALYSVKFVIRGQWGRFLLTVLPGALFHKSILVVIPLYVLASLPWKKWMLVLAGLFCTTFFLFQDFYLKLVVFLYPTYEGTEYLEGGTSYVNILRCAAVLMLSLLCYRQSVQGYPRNRFYFYCNLGALALYVCCSFLPIISRIGLYLTITHIFFLPALLRGIARERMRRLFMGLSIAAAVCYFAMFLYKAPQDGLRLLPYQTFLFHDMVPISSEVN